MVLADVLPLELLRRLALSRALHEYEDRESSVVCERSGVVADLVNFCRPFGVGLGEEILRGFMFSSVIEDAVEAPNNGR